MTRITGDRSGWFRSAQAGPGVGRSTVSPASTAEARDHRHHRNPDVGVYFGFPFFGAYDDYGYYGDGNYRHRGNYHCHWVKVKKKHHKWRKVKRCHYGHHRNHNDW